MYCITVLWLVSLSLIPSDRLHVAICHDFSLRAVTPVTTCDPGCIWLSCSSFDRVSRGNVDRPVPAAVGTAPIPSEPNCGRPSQPSRQPVHLQRCPRAGLPGSRSTSVRCWLERSELDRWSPPRWRLGVLSRRAGCSRPNAKAGTVWRRSGRYVIEGGASALTELAFVTTVDHSPG